MALSRYISGVYTCINVANSKIYIGSSIDILRRINRHKCELKKGVHHSQYLQHSYNKYGIESFVWLAIEYCNEEDLIAREQYWIDKLSPEYNLLPFAYRTAGVKRRRETCERISTALTGRKLSIEHIEACRKGRNEKLKEGYFGVPKIPIAQYSLDEQLVALHDSAADAARDFGFNRRAIVNCLTGQAKTSAGYIWKKHA